ncbi:hypothetical protein D3C78_1126890 [compost metagenome]
MVAVGNAVQTITGGRGKAQPTGQLFTVDRVGGTGQRTAAQWADVQALQRVLQTAFVTRQHFHIGQAPVGKGHRLRTLQVGISRHYRVLIGFGSFHQRLLQLHDGLMQFADLLFAPQFQIGRDLIVTATAGVQLFTEIADLVDQLLLHPAVNIFRIAADNRLRIGLHLFQQHAQSLLKLLLLGCRQYVDGDQRFRPGHRTHNVLFRQAIIEAQRIV